MAYSTITLGSLTLKVDRIIPEKVPGTVKQVVGKDLIPKNIPGRTVQDWKLIVQGKLYGSTRHTDRTTLESYDDGTTHQLTDGIHDGRYYMVGLTYNDMGNRPTSYSFTLSLVQDQ